MSRTYVFHSHLIKLWRKAILLAMSEAVSPTSEAWIPADTFAARLVLLRHHLGLSQVEAAERCGLDDGSWSNWERGSSPRRQADVAKAISQGLGVSLKWLLLGGDASTRWLDEPAGQHKDFRLIGGTSSPHKTGQPPLLLSVE